MPKIEIEINDEAFDFFTESAARARRSVEDEIAVGLEHASRQAAKYRRLSEQLISALADADEDEDSVGGDD